MRRTMLLVPAVALIALAGCVPAGSGLGVVQVPPAFAQAEEAYLLGDYSRARSLFARFKDTRVTDPFVPWADYWIGKCDLQMGRLRSAKLSFQRALAAQLGPDLDAAAMIGLGDAWYNEKDYRQAYAYYRRVKSSRLAGKVRAEELEFKLGMSLKELGNVSTADRHFGNVVAADPSGTYGKLAEKMKSRPEAAAPPASRGGAYYVQTGVFSKAANARESQNALRAKGFRAYVTREQRGGTAFYSVRVGSYRTEAEAKATARRVQAAGFQCMVKQ